MGRTKGNVEVLIASIGAGQSLTMSAQAAGMSESTARRRLRDPYVQAAVAEEYADARRQTTAVLRDMRALAMDRVTEILITTSDPPLVLRAAELVLRHASAADNGWLFEQVAAQASAIAELQEELADGD